AICRTFRVNPVVRHALWVLVLIKFITPPVMTWPWPVPDPLGIQALDAQRIQAAPISSAEPTLAPVSSSDAPRSLSQNPGTQDSGLGTRDPGLQGNGREILSWALVIWGAGAIVILRSEAVRLLRIP